MGSPSSRRSSSVMARRATASISSSLEDLRVVAEAEGAEEVPHIPAPLTAAAAPEPPSSVGRSPSPAAACREAPHQGKR
eukprot:CAMPEP_0182880824 /NCGR_PEP_ID=MMETSP0034_2-20130328/16798_1 /TAXON_ID=156128 /ORGANISM="Nephroselmis pyriformis, Strain CCMP717" /LENGTH=78 /DNA_ID=CAMNT_0025013825 /DNA_START=142 /DNA_END=374 /DNA_ORIENTATION=+